MMDDNTVLDYLQQGPNVTISICPWQELTLLPNKHWQIDLLPTIEDMTAYNPTDMSWDLQLMFYGYKRESALMKLPKAFSLITYHSSSGIWPIHGEANYTKPIVGTIYDELDLQRGWIYDRVDKAVDYLVAVRKEKDGTFELSGAMFAIQK